MVTEEPGSVADRKLVIGAARQPRGNSAQARSA
jgi:hypothetical protein